MEWSIWAESFPLFAAALGRHASGKRRCLQERELVLYFYPKDMTSGCTLEGQDFRDLHAAFRRAKTTVLGISQGQLRVATTSSARRKSCRSTCCPTRTRSVCKLFDVIQEKACTAGSTWASSAARS